MPTSDIEKVLANWIRQATSQPGQLPGGLDPSQWVTQQFLRWWRTEGMERSLGGVELAVQGIRSELERLGGWENPELGKAMHELIHLSNTLAELRETPASNADANSVAQQGNP